MGIMGLALPWEQRIPPAPCERERRVEPFRNETAAPDSAAEALKADKIQINVEQTSQGLRIATVYPDAHSVHVDRLTVQRTARRARSIAKALRKMRHPTRIRQLSGFLEAPEP